MSEAELDIEVRRISERVRRWRDEAGLTLQELAAKSGVATSTIQKIETGQMVPSVAVVVKVARGLGRPVADLVRDGPDDAVEVVVLRAAERHPVGVAGKLVVERLTGDLSDPALETWRVTLHPGLASGPGSIRYDGEELVICERGAVAFRVGETEHLLQAGDTLHFKADIAHAWRNPGDEPAVFTVTGTLPEKFRVAMRERIAARSAD